MRHRQHEVQVPVFRIPAVCKQVEPDRLFEPFSINRLENRFYPPLSQILQFFCFFEDTVDRCTTEANIPIIEDDCLAPV